MTNQAAIGYMILAAKRLQQRGEPISKELISELKDMMRSMMDMKTEWEAERAYDLWR
jgi:hypothetical protein